MKASMVSWMGRRLPTLTLIAATTLLGNYSAFGQCADVTNNGTCADASSDTCDPNLNHGNGARIGPAATCVGETLRMTGEWFWADSFLDAWVATAGTLTVGGVSQGSQPITLISGNAVCTGGAACSGALPNAGCTFPCMVGPAGCACSASGLTLPGAPTNGLVRVRGDNYVVQPGDNGKIATFTFPSQSFSTCAGAPFSQLASTSAALQAPSCSDTNPCNIDCCSLGVCSHPSTCDGATCRGVNGTVTTFPPLVCNDNSDCTGPDTCNASLPNSSPQQCCSYPPIPCPTPDICHGQEECEADGGCPPQTSVCDDPTFSCDDNNDCTEDSCDDTATGTGCCVHTNICVCGDGNIDPTEACDGDSRAPGVTCSDTCDAQCTCCGDGVRQTDEQCDGAETGSCTNGCEPDCTCTPVCEIEVVKACCLPAPPPAQSNCDGLKPISTLTMKWMPGTGGPTSTPVLPTNQVIGIKAYSTLVGSAVVGTLNNVQPGDTVTFTGFGAGNNVEWQIFDTTINGALLGKSTFHISCSDDDMDGSEDCAKMEGDGKDLSGFINDWVFEGMEGNGLAIDCTPSDPGALPCAPPSTEPFNCDALKPIRTLTMQWMPGTGGPSSTPVLPTTQVIGITAYSTLVGSAVVGTRDNVQPGEIVTFTGFGAGNNVEWQIFNTTINGTLLGKSTFHISCSDDDMDGPEDCAKMEGDGKGLSGFINDWVFIEMAGDNAALDCNPTEPTPTTQCEVPRLDNPYVCTKPIDSLSMTWTGVPTIRIRAWKGAVGSTLLADINNVVTGQLVTVTGFAGSPNDVFWQIFQPGTTTPIGIGNSLSSFHLSCSDDDMDGPEDCDKLEGDGKGLSGGYVNLWRFEGMAGAGKTLDCENPFGLVPAPVTYLYAVTNKTGVPVAGVTLTDTITDSTGTSTVVVDGPFDLAPNETKNFLATAFIDEETSDVATVSNGECQDSSDPVTVTVEGSGSGGCVSGANVLTLHDKEARWILVNNTRTGLAISKITITWPIANGDLDEIKRDGDRIHSADLSPPSAIITVFEGRTNNRTIKAGATDVLKFKFRKNAVAGNYDITVDFSNGCSISLP